MKMYWLATGSLKGVRRLQQVLMFALISFWTITASAVTVAPGESTRLVPTIIEDSFGLSLDFAEFQGFVEIQDLDAASSILSTTDIFFDSSGDGRFEFNTSYRSRAGTLIDIETLFPGLDFVGQIGPTAGCEEWTSVHTVLSSGKQIWSFCTGDVITIDAQNPAQVEVITPFDRFVGSAPAPLIAHPSAIRVQNNTAGAVEAEVTNPLPNSLIAGVQLFYNNSAHDFNGPAVGASDFDAIPTDKAPLGLGETASFGNISGYSRGINGLFFDIEGPPADGAQIDATDFSLTIGNDDSPSDWTAAPAPISVGVLAGQGEAGSDRVYLTFADGAITDTWLRVTVKANADTGLAVEEDFFFGAAPGETGASFLRGIVGVDAADLQSIAHNLTPLADSGTELITEPNDVNRDGTINAFDLQVVAINLDANVLRFITPQLPTAAAIGVPEPHTGVLLAMTAAAIIALGNVHWFVNRPGSQKRARAGAPGRPARRGWRRGGILESYR